MRKLLITGASGFLGYNLCRDLMRNYSVYATRHTTQPVCDVAGLVKMDLAGSKQPLEDWMGQNGIQGMIHCAAMSKAAPCKADPKRARLMNVDATRELAQIAQKRRIPFIFISTDLVYNSGPGPHAEDDADPRLVYSETKFDAETAAFIVYPSTVVLRCALIFGNDDGVHGSFLRDNEVDLKAGKHLKLFTDQYRSPVWSRDIADAIHRIVSQGIRSRIFNAGGSSRINRYELGLMAAKWMKWNEDQLIPVSMTGITSDAASLRDCSLDSTRLQTETGWCPTPLDEALARVAEEWRDPKGL